MVKHNVQCTFYMLVSVTDTQCDTVSQVVGSMHSSYLCKFMTNLGGEEHLRPVNKVVAGGNS